MSRGYEIAWRTSTLNPLGDEDSECWSGAGCFMAHNANLQPRDLLERKVNES
jgi:hypothetical protein